MDGLAEIIKMLEERLGTRLALTLLWLVAFAVAAWALHTIVVYLVVPGAHVIGDTYSFLTPHVRIEHHPAPLPPPPPSMRAKIILDVVSGVVGIGLYALMVKLVLSWHRRRMEQQEARIRAELFGLPPYEEYES